MVKGRYEKMKKIRSLMILFYLLFLVSFNIGVQLVYAEDIISALGKVEGYNEIKDKGYQGFENGKVYKAEVRNPKTGKMEVKELQCADFVKVSNREDLREAKLSGNAKALPDNAKNLKFEVNNIPRIGSAIVLPNITFTDDKGIVHADGHTGIVTGVTLSEGKYKLTIQDAHSFGDNIMHEAEYIYDLKESKVESMKYKVSGKVIEKKPKYPNSFSDVSFIHEKKEDFDKKVDSVIKNIANISGVALAPTQVEKYAEEIRDGKILTTEELQSKLEFIKSAEKQTISGTKEKILEAPQIIPTALSTLPISPELAKKISLDSSKYSECTAQQLLTPVNVSFTQTFDGLFTQSADYLDSPGGNHSGIFTDGTRVGVGSRPGDFTSGSFSGRTIGEPGWTPVTWTNEPFSGSSVGTATARGFQEGDLKGDMTITVPAGTQTATLSGKITIKTDGSLDMPSYSGPITDSSIGDQKVGTMSGSLNQGPTH
jgi:hypothetical protein